MKKAASWIAFICLTLSFFVGGVIPTAYATEDPLTRGTAAQLMVDTFGFEYDSTMTIPFTDVPEDSPYYKAICIMFHRGILNGVGSSRFDVYGNVTREMLATILFRTANLSSTVPDEIPSDISAWAFESVCSILAHNIMYVNENGKFDAYSQAYASDINFAALDTALSPTTSDAASLDLAKGSITISENIRGVLVFQQGETIIRTSAAAGIIRQTNNVTPTSNTITVESGECELTIASLNVEATEEQSPILVKEGAQLNLTLLGNSTLKGGNYNAGIQVSNGADLFIDGSGTVTSIGGRYGAGIGSGYKLGNGTITIKGGNISANGGTNGAGIGGGNYKSGGVINIVGGKISAKGGSLAPGIGGGAWGGGGVITIEGGHTTVKGGGLSVDLGAGEAGDGGVLNIIGGTVIIDAWNTDTNIGYIGAGTGTFDAISISNQATVVEAQGKELLIKESIYVDVQPMTAAASDGNVPILKTEVRSHSGASYQWQTSHDNKYWDDLEGETSAKITNLTMTEELNSVYLRCKLTNGWGNVEYTDAVQIYVLAFAQQPTSVEANLNDMVAFEAASTCSNVTYQWQRSYDEGETWSDVPGETFSTLIVNATLSESAAKYRCIITATNGDELASNVVSVEIDLGDLVTYTVQTLLQKADGSGYVIESQQVVEGISGATVTAPAASYPGFSENSEKGTPSGTVAADNSLVLTRYFDRETYSITFDTMGGGALPDLEALYGAALEIPSDPSRYGYDFIIIVVTAFLYVGFLFCRNGINSVKHHWF